MNYFQWILSFLINLATLLLLYGDFSQLEVCLFNLRWVWSVWGEIGQFVVSLFKFNVNLINLSKFDQFEVSLFKFKVSFFNFVLNSVKFKFNRIINPNWPTKAFKIPQLTIPCPTFILVKWNFDFFLWW